MDKENAPHPQLPPCSICGAGPEKRKWSKTPLGAYGSGHIMIISEERQSFWVGSNPKLSEAVPVVCTQCGYVQFFVNPEDFRDDKPAT